MRCGAAQPAAHAAPTRAAGWTPPPVRQTPRPFFALAQGKRRGRDPASDWVRRRRERLARAAVTPGATNGVGCALYKEAARTADVFRIGGEERGGWRRKASCCLKKTYTSIFMSRKLQRLRDHDINPCLAETDASRKCMDDSNYNKDVCTIYFLRYKNCRKFWNGIMMQRRKDGIKPDMPTAEERDRILASMERVPY